MTQKKHILCHISRCTDITTGILTGLTFEPSYYEGNFVLTTVLDSRRRLACSASASLFLASSISSLAWVKRASDCSFRFFRNSATFSRAATHFLSAFTNATRTRTADDSTWLVCNPASSGNLHLVSNPASLGNWHLVCNPASFWKHDLEVDHSSLLAGTAS